MIRHIIQCCQNINVNANSARRALVIKNKANSERRKLAKYVPAQVQSINAMLGRLTLNTICVCNSA